MDAAPDLKNHWKELEYDDERNYQRLVTALEASQGILNLLIAVCDDEASQRQVTERYEAELREQGVFCAHLRVNHKQPSLRLALEQVVAQQPAAMAGEAALTVEGVDGLLSLRLSGEQSQQDRFFGYLQWTREALLEFKFPIVVWMGESVVDRLAERAPDFWSWRGGVFWFEGRPQAERVSKGDGYATQQQPQVYQFQSRGEQRKGALSVEELLRLIESVEAQQGEDAPLLSSLYGQLGEAYDNRGGSGAERHFAIEAYEAAVASQRRQGLREELAKSLYRLGKLYFELQDDVARGKAAFEEAIELYREFGDRHGEANTLQAIGDVLQFKKRTDEALESYQQAIDIYRTVGDRLGEANTLQAIGDVLQFKKRTDEALDSYQQAIDIYRTVGASLGEANALQGLASLEEDKFLALEALERAQQIYENIGDNYSQGRNLVLFIGPTQLQLGQTKAALQSFQTAAEIGQAINFEALTQYAQQKIDEIQTSSD